MKHNTKYWLDEAKESLVTAEVLLKKKRYLESAFFCHLTIEKVLKALITERTEEIPPKTHNLLLLAAKGLTEEELDMPMKEFFAEIMPFQIESRYPSDRLKLLRENPPAKFAELFKKTKEMLKCLNQKLK